MHILFAVGQRVGLALVGVVLAAVVLEGALRAAGWLYLWRQEQQNQPVLETDRPYRILCIGESTMAFGGKQSFPRQLERALNTRPGRRVTVINKGVPGITTAAILERLPGHLERYRPDAVVAMIGINDPPGPAPVRAATDSLRGRLRVVKFVRFLWDQLRTPRRRRALVPPTLDDPAAKEARLRARLGADDGDEAARTELGTLYLAQDRLEEARPLLERAAAAPGAGLPARVGLVMLRRRAGDAGGADVALAAMAGSEPIRAAALGALVRRYDRLYGAARGPLGMPLLLRESTDERAARVLGESCLGVAEELQRAGRLDEAQVLLRESANLLGASADQTARLALLVLARGDQQGYDQLRAVAESLRPGPEGSMTARSYRALAALLRQRGVRLVAAQYPLRKVDRLRAMVGDDPEVVVVDNEGVLREALRAAPYERYFSDAFAGDFGHMTPEGNRLLAANVAAAIRSRLLPD